MEELNAFQAKINESYSQSLPASLNPGEGDVCCVKCKDDKLYYRGRVVRKLTPTTSQVILVDYGNHEIHPNQAIYQLRAEFVSLPEQGFIFKLADISGKFNTKQLKEMFMNVTLKLELKPCDIAGICYAELTNSITNEAILNTLKNSSVTNGPQEVNPGNLQVTQAVKMYQKLRLNDKEDVMVCYIESPLNYFCHVVGTAENYLSMRTKLTKVSEAELEFQIPKEGIACLAKYSEDGQLYRCQILKVFPGSSAEVQFVDFGNREEVNADVIFKISDEFLSLPSQAVHCALSGTPATVTADVTTKFEELVLDKVCKASVKNNNNKEPMEIDLINSQGNSVCNQLFGIKKVANTPPKTSSGFGSKEGDRDDGNQGKSKDVKSPPRNKFGSSRISEPTPPWYDNTLSSAPAPQNRQTLVEKVRREPVILKDLVITSGSQREFRLLSNAGGNEWYVRLTEGETELETLTVKLQVRYSALESCNLQVDDLRTGGFCCARDVMGEAWYRAQIITVTNNWVKLHLVDQGRTCNAAIVNCRILEKEFTELPMQAIKCNLSASNLIPKEYVLATIEGSCKPYALRDIAYLNETELIIHELNKNLEMLRKEFADERTKREDECSEIRKINKKHISRVVSLNAIMGGIHHDFIEESEPSGVVAEEEDRQLVVSEPVQESHDNLLASENNSSPKR